MVNCKISHKNIAKFIEVHETATDIFLIFELVEGNQLISTKNQFRFTNFDIKSIIFSTLKLIQYLQNLKIVHRDIKPSNILFASKKDTKESPNDKLPLIKLVDFGLSSWDSRDIEYFCGTPGFIAPELYFDRREENFNSKIDLFSVGVIFHYLQFGRYPLLDVEQGKTLRAFDDDVFQISDFSDQTLEQQDFLAYDLMKKMLVLDPKKRYTVDECLGHLYFKTYDDAASLEDCCGELFSGDEEGICSTLLPKDMVKKWKSF